MRVRTPRSLKKGLAAVVGSVLVVSLAACGGSTSGSESKDELVIAATLPLSGINASLGEALNQGAKLAVEEVNAGGTLGDLKLKLEIEDNQGRDENGLNSTRGFADKGYFAMLSTYTGLSLAIVPILEESKMVAVNIGGSGNALEGASSRLFNIIPLTKFETSAVVSYVRDQGLETAAVIVPKNEYGKSLRGDFEKAWEESGGKLLGTQEFEVESSDVRSQLQVIRNKKPDVLFIGAQGSDGVTVVNQARQLGIKSQFAAISSFVQQEIIDTPAADGTIHTTFAVEAPEFESAFDKKYGETPNAFALNAYDAIKAYAQAIAKIQKAGDELNGDRLQAALSDGATFDGGGEDFSFTKKNTVVKPITVVQIKDGKDTVLKKQPSDQ